MITLKNGDCFELMNTVESGTVDMVLTDPPYGMDFQSNRRVATEKFKKIENDKNLDWLDDFIDQCHRVMAANSCAYFFCSWHNVDVFKMAIQRKLKVKNLIVWVKNNHGSGDLTGGYAPQHELIIYATKGRVLNRGKRVPDVIYADKIPSKKLLHPTEKNIPMLETFINQHTDAGMMILDPFMGSGTTAAACKNTDRNFIGFELNEEYFSVAESRLSAI